MSQARPPLLLAALCLALAARAFATVPYNHGDTTPEEQLLLEMVNRARANPSAEAARYGLANLNDGLAAGTITTDPKPPLALNPRLLQAARGHSQWMVDTDTFSHTGAGGTSSKERMVAAGYPLGGSWGTGENIAGAWSTAPQEPVAVVNTHHRGLFLSSGHRKNLLNPKYDETGFGIRTGAWVQSGVTYPYASLAAQNFAYSGSSPSPEGPFITGVVYRDLDGDNFYTPGEGISGVTVTPSAGAYHAVTGVSGGYAIPVGSAAAILELTYAGGPFSGQHQIVTLPGGQNVKVDVRADKLPQPPSLSVSGSTVTMATPTTDAVIRYATGGGEPTASSPAYNPVTKLVLPSGVWIVKAKTFKESIASPTASSSFTIYLPVTASAPVRASSTTTDGRSFITYATPKMNLARTSADRAVYLSVDIPSASAREGGQAVYFGLEVLRSQVVATDKIWFKQGGTAPYAGMPDSAWTPSNFSTVIDRTLPVGRWYFKILLSGTTTAPAAGALGVWTNFRVARFVNNTGTPVTTLDPAKPLWLVIHGKNEGENAFRALNNALRAGAGTTQVATVDWAQTASTTGYGRHFINLGRNLSDLLVGKGLPKSGVNIAAHSHGASIGFETSFIFGGVNRFLAMDPAVLAGGGYSDARPNFRQQTIGGRSVVISTLSTGIKGGATAGTLGNDAMAATCHRTLRLLSNTHTGAAVNAAFFNNLSKDWVRRAMVVTTDAYWSFIKSILLTSQSLPWTGADMGGGFDIECHGATSRIDNTAPVADVDSFIKHNFLLFKSTAGDLTDARATKAADGTVIWSFTKR